MTYLVDPQSLLFNAKTVPGFLDYLSESSWEQWDLLQTAQEVVEEWTYRWPDDQGFGSSDMTFMIQDLIDSLIVNEELGYTTRFNPNLQVVKG
jgi:hypothetical protein